MAGIIGAPKNEILLSLIKALHEGSTEKALEALAEAVSLHVDMKLFARLILENLRAVMLLRHQPAKSEELLANFGPASKTFLQELAKVSPSPLNSQMLLRLLSATQQINYSPIPHLPLEIAVIELTTKK